MLFPCNFIKRYGENAFIVGMGHYYKYMRAWGGVLSGYCFAVVNNSGKMSSTEKINILRIKLLMNNSTKTGAPASRPSPLKKSYAATV